MRFLTGFMGWGLHLRLQGLGIAGLVMGVEIYGIGGMGLRQFTL